MAPIPIALCGKNLTVAQNFSNLMLPEYEVVHVCTTPETAITELTALLSGHPTKPTSLVGTNTNADSASIKTPQALFVGGGWTSESIDQMRESDEVMRSIPYVYPGREFMEKQKEKGGPPAVEGIVEALKGVLGGEGLREGRMGVGIYHF